MDILFLAFANNREQPLPALQAEDETIYSLLAPRQAQQHFLIHRDSFTSIASVTEYLALYKEDIVLFHYSGHAGAQSLLLEGEEAFTQGIATLLGKCPRLKLAVLNGCSTNGQVEALLDMGVPVVVATSAPVDDQKASEFAIQFFRALGNQDEISTAFDLAKGKALVMDGQLTFHRGLDFSGNSADATWGLFYKNENPEQLQWSLPAVPFGYQSGEFQPNLLLLESLINSLADYNDAIRQINENETLGMPSSILDKREAVLKCLPHPISEQVRKLLVPETAGSQTVFYDKLGPDRLRQMVAVYETIIELFGYIMLAQLWDALNDNPGLKVPEDLKNKIKIFFGLSPVQRQVYEFIPLIQHVRKLFDQEQIPYFLEELSDLRLQYDSGLPLYEACQFMESMRHKMVNGGLGKPEADTLCIMAEEKLAIILTHMGFIGRYTFASVKAIDVVKYRHIKEARFKHTIVKLIQRFVGLAEEPQVLDKFMDNTSVLLLREHPERRAFLNLTPFIIDENAFDEKASIAKLHFFQRYVKDQDAYAYRHIYKPGDLPLVVAKQTNFLILKAQFDAFSRLLFNQPLQQAL